MIDSAWRAAAYCLQWRVMLLSIAPILLVAPLAFGLSYFFWTDALDAVNGAFASWDLLQAMFNWLEAVGLRGFKSLLAPLVVIFLATPVVAVLSMLTVALLAAPFLLRLVAQRRFPQLERRRGGTWVGSLFVTLSATAVAALALVVSIPFWLVPPVALVVPPLIWGWLTYRVLSYDVLAEHAAQEERRVLMHNNRLSLWVMGVVSGLLSGVVSVIWPLGGMLMLYAPWLIPVVVWVYTLVFIFSALWFAHFLLAKLEALRAQAGAVLTSENPA
ncbi:MAG: EI24 domain-containing protein [Cytophagales bacterium]|nr:EI24 domain-containing protein [Rhizobacter sp.]